jgi:hypothetical protein
MLPTYAFHYYAIILTKYGVYEMAFGGRDVVTKRWWIQSIHVMIQMQKEACKRNIKKKKEETRTSDHTYERRRREI